MHFSVSFGSRLSKRSPLTFPTSGFGVNFDLARRIHLDNCLRLAHLAAKTARALKKLWEALLTWAAEV